VLVGGAVAMGDNSNTGSMDVDNATVAAPKNDTWQDQEPSVLPKGVKRSLPPGSPESIRGVKKIIMEKREKSPSPTPSSSCSSSNTSPEEGEIIRPYIFPKKTIKNKAAVNQDKKKDIGPSTSNRFASLPVESSNEKTVDNAELKTAPKPPPIFIPNVNKHWRIFKRNAHIGEFRYFLLQGNGKRQHQADAEGQHHLPKNCCPPGQLSIRFPYLPT